MSARVWKISDLVKHIVSFKKQMEHASDLQKLNKTHSFQHLLYSVFFYEYNSGLILRNELNNDRLSIKINKYNYPIVFVTFEAYQKYKRTLYYSDNLFLNFDHEAVYNQHRLSQHILNDHMLLPFFQYEYVKSICNH